MSIYGRELNPMIEKRTQVAFKGKREHIATTNTPNIAYSGQQFKIKIPKGSIDHVIYQIPLKSPLISKSNQQTRHLVLQITLEEH